MPIVTQCNEVLTVASATPSYPMVAVNEWPNPPWNVTAYEWDAGYPSLSPEWFAQQTALNALKYNITFSTEDRYAQYRKQERIEQQALAARVVDALPVEQAGQDAIKAVNGVLTDTHLYYQSSGQFVSMQLLTRPAHVGDIMQLCLEHNLQTIWVIAGAVLSDLATQDFIDAARNQWEVKSARYTSGPKGHVARAMFLSGWKKKEARSIEESGRVLYVGYAEHNEDWQLDEVDNPVTLLNTITYLEDALGVPVLFSAGYTGRLLIEKTNTKRRVEWVKQVDIAAIEPALTNPLMTVGVSDISWKRPLTDVERAIINFLVAYDKNSMYPASCTSVLLGTGEPEYKTRPTFDYKNILPGVWHCSISGTSDFDGVNLPHPTDGVTCGWFWTYTVKLLHELGYTVEIDEAYVWRKEDAHTILRPFAEEAWNARASLDDKLAPNVERYPDEQARALACKGGNGGSGVKLVLVKSLGWLDMTEKVRKAGKTYEGYRPDWYALLKDNARYQMFWRIRTAISQGYKPVGVHADCLYFIAPMSNHEQAIPHMMERKNVKTKLYEPAHTKLGGFKQKYKTPLTVEQVQSFFDDPTLDMGQVNKQLLAIDKAAKKEQV